MFNTIDDLASYIRKELAAQRPKDKYFVVTTPVHLGEAKDVHRIVIQSPDRILEQIVDMASIRQMYVPESFGRYFVMGVLKKFREEQDG